MGIGPMLIGLSRAIVMSTAPTMNPAMPTSRCAVGVFTARRSANQPPASVPIRPPTTITTPDQQAGPALGHVEAPLEDGRQPERVRGEHEIEEGLGEEGGAKCRNPP